MAYASLSNLKLGPYTIHERIGSGAFGTVYRASIDDGHSVAIKVANQGRPQGSPADDKNVLSMAFGVYSGGYGAVNPSPAALFQLQCKRSQTSPILPHTEGPFVIAETHFLVMEFIKGMTLRRLLNQGLQSGGAAVNDLDLAVKVFESLAELEASALTYHGDIKPDNIILSGAGVRLTDPGYFGSIACAEGLIPLAVITTPSYYPCLEPDDSFACGAVLWEIALGRHPIIEPADTDSGSGSDAAQLQPGPALRQWIASQELIGRYFLSPIANLVPPPERSSSVAKLLLRSLGLEIRNSDTLEKISHPMKASAILEELLNLKKSGVTALNQTR